MALEIKSYHGNGDDLADLIVSSWRETLGNEAWFPIWDRDFIRWKVMDDRILDRDLVVCAYLDGRIVGCMVAVQYDFRVGGEVLAGSACSFLSVDSSYKRPGLSLRMAEEMRKRHLDRGLRLSMGVRNVAPGSVAKKFWAGFMKRHPGESQVIGRIRSWVHVFDGAAVARASIQRWEAIEGRLGGFVPLGWIGSRGQGHPCDPHNIAQDLEIVARANARAQAEQLYDETSLAHALHHPYCYSMRHPTAEAIVACYMIDWSGRETLRVGFIDLVSGLAGTGDMADLIIHAAREAKKRGAQMMVMMDQGAAPAIAFWRAGFVPTDSQVEYFAWYKDPELDLPAGTNFAVSFT